MILHHGVHDAMMFSPEVLCLVRENCDASTMAGRDKDQTTHVLAQERAPFKGPLGT